MWNWLVVQVVVDWTWSKPGPPLPFWASDGCEDIQHDGVLRGIGTVEVAVEYDVILGVATGRRFEGGSGEGQAVLPGRAKSREMTSVHGVVGTEIDVGDYDAVGEDVTVLLGDFRGWGLG